MIHLIHVYIKKLTYPNEYAGEGFCIWTQRLSRHINKLMTPKKKKTFTNNATNETCKKKYFKSLKVNFLYTKIIWCKCSPKDVINGQICVCCECCNETNKKVTHQFFLPYTCFKDAILAEQTDNVFN